MSFQKLRRKRGGTELTRRDGGKCTHNRYYKQESCRDSHYGPTLDSRPGDRAGKQEKKRWCWFTVPRSALEMNQSWRKHSQ